MRCLGIIGTAGRGTDGQQLKTQRRYWSMMKSIAHTVATVVSPECLVSGGASFSDHLAVQLFLEGLPLNLSNKPVALSLHFPTDFGAFGFAETLSKFSPGKTSNYYHALFGDIVGINSLEEISKAIAQGARVTIGTGFKERNTVIANEAHTLLAFTFGNGRELKDGGTKDTMDKFLRRRQGDIHDLEAYHFCLNNKRLYEL